MRAWRWIIAITCLLVLSVVAVHVYLARQTEAQLEKLASHLVLAGRLSWERILIHPRGEVRVSALRFEPRAARDPLRIDEVRFRSRNLAQLALALREIQGGQVPAGLRINLSGARLPVGPPYSDWLSGHLSPALPHSGAGCNFDERQLTDLNRLDYWELAVEGQLDYQLVVGGEQLDLQARLAVSQLADWRFRARLEMDEESLAARINMLAPAMLASRLLAAEIEFNDLGFHQRLHHACRQQLGLENEPWLERHLMAWREAWAMQGLAPDEIAEAAYRAFLDQPDSFSLETRPDPPFALANLEEMTILASLPYLDIFFRVNESAPVPLRMTIVAPPAPALPEEVPQVEEAPVEPSRQQPAPGLIDPTTQALPVVVPPGWRSASLESAEEFVNQPVRLLMQDDSRASGLLVAVDEQALYLEIRSRQGLLVRPFLRARIADFWVHDRG